jgi:hypothetical protein
MKKLMFALMMFSCGQITPPEAEVTAKIACSQNRIYLNHVNCRAEIENKNRHCEWKVDSEIKSYDCEKFDDLHAEQGVRIYSLSIDDRLKDSKNIHVLYMRPSIESCVVNESIICTKGSPETPDGHETRWVVDRDLPVNQETGEIELPNNTASLEIKLCVDYNDDSIITSFETNCDKYAVYL